MGSVPWMWGCFKWKSSMTSGSMDLHTGVAAVSTLPPSDPRPPLARVVQVNKSTPLGAGSSIVHTQFSDEMATSCESKKKASSSEMK